METLPSQFSNVHPDQHAAPLLFPSVTMILVLATLTGTVMNAPLILGLLVVGVVLLGLPHGSLDPLVARQLFAGNRRFTMANFVISYTLISVLCVVGWLAAPNIALSLFLIISALHFGSDWQHRGSIWGRAAYGVCVVSVPTLHHAEAVRQVYVQLGATASAGIVSVSRVVALLAVAVAFLSLIRQIRLRWLDCLELAVILTGGLALPPLVFFTCYFCLLHSPQHLVATSRDVGLRGLRALITAVTPAVGATLLLAALLWRLLPANNTTSRALEIVFIGLAALTVPHMLLTAIKERKTRRSGKWAAPKQARP